MDLRERAEKTAGAILSASGLLPGSPPSQIARALDIPISVRQLEDPLVRASSNRILRCIWIAPCAYGPRRELSVGHELMELALATRLPHDQHELFCQRGAAALLMPGREFSADGRSCNWDLAHLRRRWVHASWEAIASRAADLLEHVSASAWNGPTRKFLRGVPVPHLSGRALLLEAQAAAEAVGGRGHVHLRLPGVSARAWRIGKCRAVSICSVSE